VKVFKDGAVVDEFFGALPESEVRAFLRRHCPTAADRKYNEALLQTKQGRSARARSLLEEALQADPSHGGALLELGRMHAAEGNASEALALWDRIPYNSPAKDQAERMKQVLDFQAVCESGGGMQKQAALAASQPDNLEARYAHGCCLALDGDYRGALEEFLFVVGRDRSFKDQAARRAMLTIFGVVGDRSELAEEYRKRLAQVLF
jgi:putative thioredoxin